MVQYGEETFRALHGRWLYDISGSKLPLWELVILKLEKISTRM